MTAAVSMTLRGMDLAAIFIVCVIAVLLARHV